MTPEEIRERAYTVVDLFRKRIAAATKPISEGEIKGAVRRTHQDVTDEGEQRAIIEEARRLLENSGPAEGA